MEFGINRKRIKVVWLCHFINQEMMDYFNVQNLVEMAPWINNLIEIFKNRKEIELHIIAPNLYTNQDRVYIKDKITFCFYKRFPIPKFNRFIKKIYTILQIEERTNYLWIKSKIYKYISSINPDIIHLHGAENPYYSAGILPLINRYSILLTIQGFIRNTTELNSYTRRKIRIEDEILRKINHIGVRTEEMSRTIREINPKSFLHYHEYPIKIPKIQKDNHGMYEKIDCLFFARVCKDKGIEDLIKATALIKKEYPSISVSVIGTTNRNYLDKLKSLCAELKIQDNVQFHGFLPKQEDIYQFALQAKMCVLPTYHEIISGTIIESMFLKLPVVAYPTGSIPELNSDEERIELVEKKCINLLAKKIIGLLNDKNRRITLSERAYQYANKRFNNKGIAEDIIKIYNRISNKIE